MFADPGRRKHVGRRAAHLLSGSATVLGDIPPAEQVREAWDSWSTDRWRAAIRSMLHAIQIKPLPAGTAPNPASSIKDPAIRREREMAVLRQRVEFDWRV